MKILELKKKWFLAILRISRIKIKSHLLLNLFKMKIKDLKLNLKITEKKIPLLLVWFKDK
jgi:hypothetical protein